MNTVYVEDRNKWRAWLETNAERMREVWLVYYKKESGRPSIAYEDSVEEAICFGWIDSKIKNIDQTRFARLFTPRKPKSKWAPSNIERARRMIKEGKMTAAGAKVFDPRTQTPGHSTMLPASLEQQFRKHETAWENFTHFPRSYQRMTIGWVASAKQEATRLRRLQQLIAESSRNLRIKFI